MDYEKQKLLKPQASSLSVPVTATNPMWNPHHEYYQWMYQSLNTMYAPPFRTHPIYGYTNDCQMNGHSAEDCPMNEMYKKKESYTDPLNTCLLNGNSYEDCVLMDMYKSKHPKLDSYPRHPYYHYAHHKFHPYYQHRIFSHPM
jgi:hypothetical protein